MASQLPQETAPNVSPVLALVDALLQALRAGHLVPGQRLVEAELALRFGVARTTVREALQRLEASGFVSQERHRGFLVRTLTTERVRQIYELRATLDGLAARLATASLSADPARLDALVAAMDRARATGDLRAYTDLNRDFHALIRNAAGNTMLVELLGQLEQSVYHAQFRLLVERPQVFATQDDHRAIARAIRAGDADAAASEMQAHVERTLAELLRLPPGLFGGDRPSGPTR